MVDWIDDAWNKAKELGLTNQEAVEVTENFKQFCEFNDRQDDFMEYLFKLLRKWKEQK